MHQSEERRITDPPWAVADFVLVMLAGVAGSLLAAVVVVAGDFGVGAGVVAAAFGAAAGNILAIVAVARRRGCELADLDVDAVPADGRYVMLGALLQVALALVFAPLAQMVGSDGTTQVVADQIASITQLGTRVAVIVLVGLAVPIAEELAFRGLLLKAIQRRFSDRNAVMITAAVFSVFHWIGVDQGNSLAGLLTVIQLFVVGLVLGRLAVKHGRLGPAIFVHAGFNLVTLAVLFFAPSALGQ